MAVARQGDGAPAAPNGSFLDRILEGAAAVARAGGGPHDRLFVDRAERRAALEAELARRRAPRALAAARAE